MHQKLTDKLRERKTHSWGLEDPVGNNVQKVVVHHIFLVNSLFFVLLQKIVDECTKASLDPQLGGPLLAPMDEEGKRLQILADVDLDQEHLGIANSVHYKLED